MQRALLRLEAALTDQAGTPTKMVREAQEVGLAEFLAQSGPQPCGTGAAPHPAPGRHLPGTSSRPSRLSGPPGARPGWCSWRRPEGPGGGKTRGVGRLAREDAALGFTACGKVSFTSG